METGLFVGAGTRALSLIRLGKLIPNGWFIRGDADLDGFVELSDAVYLLAALFEGEGTEMRCPDAADTNDDSRLNISDAIYLLSSLFQGGPAIPHPYPDMGPDRTADELGCEE